jgi:hypothetical protein
MNKEAEMFAIPKTLLTFAAAYGNKGERSSRE